jgi:tetratricopeptide (TPR) repeat protein
MLAFRICIFTLSAMALIGQTPDPPKANEADPELPGLVCRAAMFAQRSADLPGAEKLARHGLALFAQNNSLESADGAACLTTLASLLASKGAEMEAQQQLESALAIRERLLGPNHFLVADTLVRLGLTYSRQGRLSEAEQIQTRAVTILRLQEPSPQLAAALNNLGTVMLAQRRIKEAEGQFREAIALWENLGGPDDSNVAAGLLNLGVLLQQRKKYDEAGRVLSRALQIDQKSLPANHPRIGMDLNAAGVLAMARKNYREAEEYLIRAAVILQGSQSPQHTETGQVLLNLAEVYRMQKKTDQARDTFERGLAAAASVWGPNDPRLPDWMDRLAATLRLQEDYAGAEELEMRATRIRITHALR